MVDVSIPAFPQSGCILVDKVSKGRIASLFEDIQCKITLAILGQSVEDPSRAKDTKSKWRPLPHGGEGAMVASFEFGDLACRL